MRRALLVALIVSTIGAGAPQGPPAVDLYISDLQEQVDSLRMRVEALEQSVQWAAETEARTWRHARWSQYVRADSTRTQCRATTKAGHQCKRKAAKSDSLCTQHRRATK